MEFARGLAEEHSLDINHGTLMSRAPNRNEEAAWLSANLMAIETGGVVSVAAEVDGKLVGNSEVRREKNEDISTSGSLGIAVAKHYRRMGLGEQMLLTLLDESRKQGVKTVELRALANNEGAVSLYEKVGFVRVGVIPKKIRRRGAVFDELVMAIEL
jgi:ribosomal protein S18 acetylase RimI-like enzyme